MDNEHIKEFVARLCMQGNELEKQLLRSEEERVALININKVLDRQ